MAKTYTDADRHAFLEKVKVLAAGNAKRLDERGYRGAVESALDELHSAYSQADFFGIRADIGGQEAIVSHVADYLENGPKPEPVDPIAQIFSKKLFHPVEELFHPVEAAASAPRQDQ